MFWNNVAISTLKSPCSYMYPYTPVLLFPMARFPNVELLCWTLIGIARLLSKEYKNHISSSNLGRYLFPYILPSISGTIIFNFCTIQIWTVSLFNLYFFDYQCIWTSFNVCWPFGLSFLGIVCSHLLPGF